MSRGSARASQSAFYGSAAWRDGPREEVLWRIESER